MCAQLKFMGNSKAQESVVEKIDIEVVYALPRCTHSLMLTVSIGTTVQQALDLACEQTPFSKLDMSEHPVGIYYEVVNDLGRVLIADDRIEIYRPLLTEPMQQRHVRAKQQAGKH